MNLFELQYCHFGSDVIVCFVIEVEILLSKLLDNRARI